MKSRKIALAVALIGALCSGGYALSQNTGFTPNQKQFVDIYGKAIDEGGADNMLALSRAFYNAPEDRSVVEHIIRTGISYRAKPEGPAVLAAVQVAQNQKIIEQNAEIIALLKAKK